MANNEHVDKLKESVSSWNEWREQNHDVALDLSDANLEGADLSHANLKRAGLSGANLEGADLSHANLKRAGLFDANLEGADLSRANLEEASFCGANLKGADLFDANLEGADLFNANLKGADLSGANLEGADLSGANLEGADLRAVINIRLDSSRIKEAQFSSRAPDPWSVLRRAYTGPMFTFSLLGLIVFSLPYIGKIGFWSYVNRGQGYTQGLLNTISQRAYAQGINDQTITELGLSSEEINSLSKCLSEACEQQSIWQLLLGMDQSGLFWMLPLILIVYNLLRGSLTYLVAPMRDEEERSGYSPIWRHRGNVKPYHKKWWQGYRVLFYAHKVVSVLGVIALITFFINAVYWLCQPIYLPV